MFASGQCYTLDRVNENSTLRHAYDAQLCSDSVRRLALTKDPAFPVPTDKLVFLMVDPHSPVCLLFFHGSVFTTYPSFCPYLSTQRNRNTTRSTMSLMQGCRCDRRWQGRTSSRTRRSSWSRARTQHGTRARPSHPHPWSLHPSHHKTAHCLLHIRRVWMDTRNRE